MAKVVITGINGQDGTFLSRYLLKNTEHQIIGTSRDFLTKSDNPRLKIKYLDISADDDSIDFFVKSEKPDYFINFAGQSSPTEAEKNPAKTYLVNVNAVIKMLDAIKKYCPSCRLYSSGSALEKCSDSIYSCSKRAAKDICEHYRDYANLFVIHGVCCNHESELRSENFVSKKIIRGVNKISEQVSLGKEISPIVLGNIFIERDWLYAGDVVEGIWKAVSNDKLFKNYLFCSGNLRSIREFLETAFSIAHIDVEFRIDSKNLKNSSFYLRNTDIVLTKCADEFFREGDSSMNALSTQTQKDLGWYPKTDFESMIKIMLEKDRDGRK